MNIQSHFGKISPNLELRILPSATKNTSTLTTHILQSKIFASNIQAPGAIVEFVEHQRLDPLVLIDIAVKVLREQNICLFRLNVCHDNI